MRSRPTSDDSVADVTRRRLDALIAELAVARGEEPPVPEQAVPEQAVPDAAVLDAARATPARSHGRRVPPDERPPGGRHAQRPLRTRRRLASWVDDRLPAAVQGRAHLGSAQFGLVALVVAVGLVVGAWWLVRSAGSSEVGEVAPPRPTVSSPAAPGGSDAGPVSSTPPVDGQPSAAAGEQIVVDVVGKVRRPGIAVLPVGSRVVDAVRAAGGMRPGVDPATVNLARLLTDGEQVAIGLPSVAWATVGPPASPGSGSGTGTGVGGGLVNLNTADQATLETLPGVGPVTAAAILEWRAERGGFTSVDELLEVSGIGDATLAEIAPHVTV